MSRVEPTALIDAEPVSEPPPRIVPDSDTDGSPYSSLFWMAYTANTSLMVAVSILFRYADFVMCLGGTESDLGWIVGLGMLGAIAVRMGQGAAIDRFGATAIWITSAGIVLASLVGHLLVTDIGPTVYVLRMFYTVGLAGFFGSSITFISSRAPANRTGEMIGALGSSGFVGMAVGPLIADFIFRIPASYSTQVDRMFYVAGGMVLLSCTATWLATRAARGTVRRDPQRRAEPMHRVLMRYQPGAVLVIAVAMGLGIGVPFSFVRPFAQQHGIDGIRGFFLVYASVAFLARIFCRRLPDVWGVRQTITLGMTFLTAEMFAFLLVRDVWTLMIPATLGGLAHSFTFPAAVTGGSLAFPLRYRGLATTLMLTMFDIGNLVGGPAVATILMMARNANLPDYPTTFVAAAICMAGCTAVYLSRERSATDGHR